MRVRNLFSYPQAFGGTLRSDTHNRQRSAHSRDSDGYRQRRPRGRSTVRSTAVVCFTAVCSRSPDERVRGRPVCKAATHLVFKDHSHISEVTSPNTADDSVTGPILQLVRSAPNNCACSRRCKHHSVWSQRSCLAHIPTELNSASTSSRRNVTTCSRTTCMRSM